ncbi:MAG: hypothetical protein ACKVRP_14810 [Bacteroidota bacterium]
MSFPAIVRYVVLAVSASAMVVGIAVMAGWLVPTQLSGDYSVILGAVVFLYGAYRFAITFYSQRRESHHGSL